MYFQITWTCDSPLKAISLATTSIQGLGQGLCLLSVPSFPLTSYLQVTIDALCPEQIVSKFTEVD